MNYNNMYNMYTIKVPGMGRFQDRYRTQTLINISKITNAPQSESSCFRFTCFALENNKGCAINNEDQSPTQVWFNRSTRCVNHFKQTFRGPNHQNKHAKI